MSDAEVNTLLGQLEAEQCKRYTAEQSYQIAVKTGDALVDEVRRLKQENADLRGQVRALVQPPKDYATYY